MLVSQSCRYIDLETGLSAVQPYVTVIQQRTASYYLIILSILNIFHKLNYLLISMTKFNFVSKKGLVWFL